MNHDETAEMLEFFESVPHDEYDDRAIEDDEFDNFDVFHDDDDIPVVTATLRFEEKIAFIVNNLSADNLDDKCKEIRDIGLDEHLPWFSSYLVNSRAANEPNFHQLYSDLLDGLNNETLDFLVVSETMDRAKNLLDSARPNMSTLKNLGHWLGIRTLAKDIPIPVNGYDLNSLFMEANQKGIDQLTVVVAFIAKVLVSCSKSQTFGPKKLWTLKLLIKLANLHDTPGLPLNLQFEIEVLYDKLDEKLADLKGKVIVFHYPKNLQNYLRRTCKII